MAQKTTDLKVRFSAEVDSYLKGLEKAERAVQRQSRAYDTLAKDMAIRGAAISGAFAWMVNSAASYGAEVDKIAKQTGVATGVISSLGYAATKNQASMESLAAGLKFLAKNMDDALAGSKAQVEAFERLGITAADLQGLGVDEVLFRISDRMKGAGDEAAKTKLAMQLFEESGAELVPLLSQGSSAIRETQEEAGRLGLVLDTQATKAFKAYSDEVARLKGAYQGFQVTVGKDVLPIFTELAEKAADVVAVYQKIPAPLREMGSGALLAEAGMMGLFALFVRGKAQLAALASQAGITLSSLTAFSLPIAIFAGMEYAIKRARERLREWGLEVHEQLSADYNEFLLDSPPLDPLDMGRLDAMDREELRRRDWSGFVQPGPGGPKPPPSRGGNNTRVITELDVLEYKLGRIQSAYRLLGDSTDTATQRQANLSDQLTVINEAVTKAETAYSQAASATGLYSEATMKAGKALDDWKQKQYEVTQSIEATTEALIRNGDVTGIWSQLTDAQKAAATVNRMPSGTRSIGSLLLASVPDLEDKIASLATARGVDLGVAQAMLTSQLMQEFAKTGNIPAERKHGGGIVAGPRGAEVPIIARAGEAVFTEEQQRALGMALGGRMAPIINNIYLNDRLVAREVVSQTPGVLRRMGRRL